MVFYHTVQAAYLQYCALFKEGCEPWTLEQFEAWLSDSQEFDHLGMISQDDVCYAAAVSLECASHAL